MALTKVGRSLLNTGVADSSDATAITISSDEDATFAGHILLADSKNVKIGAGTDLQLYHDGSNSYITNSTGALKIATETSGVAVTIGHTTSETTIADNLTVTGTIASAVITADGLDMGDSEKIRLGASQDLEIYHDGSHSYIYDGGTGNIVIKTNNGANVDIMGASEYMAKFIKDGAVELYYDDSKKIETTSAGATVTGTLTATLATAAQTNITSLGTLTTLTVDDITINGSTISDGGDLTVDVTGVLNLDATTQIILKDDGTNYGTFYQSSSDFYIQSLVQDKDLVFYGNDGGSGITALTLDMSAAGAATFNSSVNATNYLVGGAQGSDGQLLTSTGSGVAWEDAPSSGPTHKTFGTASIMIGDNATGTIDAADNNTGVGVDIFAALTTGDNNTTVGFQGLGANTTGSANAAFGTYALDANTTGDSNTAIGYGTLTNAQSADANTAVGRNALLSNSGGADNTAVGAYALDANTSGTYNTAVGRNALTSNVDGSRSTAVGYGSLAAHDPSSATDTYNTAVGFHALNAATTPSNNTAVGGNALAVNTTGTVNVAVGSGALAANTTASSNTAVGHNALTANTTGSANVAVGKDAGEAVTTGTYNTFMGYLAGTNVTTSNDNTAFGSEALRDVSTGAGNTAVGSEALVVNSGDSNTAVGFDALKANTSGASNVAVGYEAGLDLTTGSNNVFVGRSAGAEATTGGTNTVIGHQAYSVGAASAATGSNNVAVGYGALYRATSADANVAIGQYALLENTTGNANIGIGKYALDANTTADENVALGYYALSANTTGHSNTAVGKSALAANTTANSNTAVGNIALAANTTGAANVAVGRNALGANDDASNNVAVGHGALESNTTGADNTAVGYQALAATNNTRNMGIGYRALTAQSGSSDNIAIGYDALVRQTTGANGNIAIGNYAGRAVVSSASTSQLLAIGHSVASNASGALAGYQNCFVGYNIASASGLAGAFRNTALGMNSLQDLTTGDNNTTLGNMAGNSITTATNNLCLGYQAGESGSPSGTLTTGSNTIVLGDDNIGALYCTQSSINTSDRRDKADITNFTGGLDFIKKMQPVTYKWDRRSWYLPRDEEGNITDEDITKVTPNGSKKENVTHVGFIAQDVETLEKEIGFASDNTNRLLTNLTEDGNRYGMKYERLVTVLVNAVKELSTKLDAAETRIKTLEDA